MANEDVATVVRVGVAATHVFPCGEFAAGTWAALTEIDSSKVNRTIVDISWIIDGSVRTAPDAAQSIKAGARVIVDLQVISPAHRIKFSRIRLFCHIVMRKRTDVLTLL